MQTRIYRTFAIALATLCVGSVPAEAVAYPVVPLSQVRQSFGPAEKSMALSACLEHHVVRVGDSIPITFAIKDIGAPISIFRLGYIGEYELHGTGPDGFPIRKFQQKVLFAGSVRSGFMIGNGMVYQQTISTLAKQYDFAKSGRYLFYFVTAVSLEYQLAST